MQVGEGLVRKIYLMLIEDHADVAVIFVSEEFGFTIMHQDVWATVSLWGLIMFDYR